MENARSPKPTSRPVGGTAFPGCGGKALLFQSQTGWPAPQLLPHPEPGERAWLPAGISLATRPLTQPFPAELGAESRLRHSQRWDDPHSTVSFAPSKCLSQCL